MRSLPKAVRLQERRRNKSIKYLKIPTYIEKVTFSSKIKVLYRKNTKPSVTLLFATSVWSYKSFAIRVCDALHASGRHYISPK